MKYRKQK